MPWVESQKNKLADVRSEVEKELRGDHRTLVKDFLESANRCLAATSADEKMDAMILGQSDIITYLARDAVRTERVMNAKIEACRQAHKYNFGWPAFLSLLAIITTVLGILWRLGLLG